MKPFLLISCIILFLITHPAETTAGLPQGDMQGDTSVTGMITVYDWLGVQPVAVENPVFYQVGNTRNKTYSDEELLDFEQVSFDGSYPEAHALFTTGGLVTWEKLTADSAGVVTAGQTGALPRVAYFATYIRADRWLVAALEISTPLLIKGWLDGEEIGVKRQAGTDEKPGKLTKTLKLEQGKHLLLLKVIIPSNHSAGTGLKATLELKSPFRPADLEISLQPATTKTIHHMLDGLKVTDISLSPDGAYYLIHCRQANPPGDQAESWQEIRKTDGKALVYSFRHARIGQPVWLPATNRVSYSVTGNDKTSLFIYDPQKGSLVPLLQGVEKFSGYRWSPDEKYLVYTCWEEPDAQEGAMQKVEGMPDRQPGWRNRTFLYRYDIASGQHARLTWGNLSTYLYDISPDGQKLLIGQGYPDFSERPFSRQNYYILDLPAMTLDTIALGELWGFSARFSPDGKYLVATGGASCFSGAGLNLPEGRIPHNSDIQVYLMNLLDKSVQCLTKDFNPSVEEVIWLRPDDPVYLITVDKDCRRLYRYNLQKAEFTLVETGVEYLTRISFASRGNAALYQGNRANHYPAWYMMNMKKMQYTLFDDTEAETYRNVRFGEVKDWNFTAASGIQITGRVYYPPEFDSQKKYPVIVYYYGGITPVGRTFGGRYPFNIWAGNGYLVYVLQPSGAIGFGQEFSSAHVNNWGTTVADEIIEGTRKFLEAHPFADKAKVGCAGASYGGFMTMLLLTRTDIFAAAIAHAGISSIASYWGEGYWGYSYSAGASANSFPWNNKDLYVGQSPLFHAHKIHTPLLLTHGDDDTNVPPGESIQMYTALKLLNRPVELVLVKGENHHIITYSKRIQWHNTLMAWWDMQLKGQPEWWEEMYPRSNY